MKAKHINFALAAAVIAGISLAVLTIDNFIKTKEFGTGLITLAVILGLTFGVYKKSRICAVLLFACFVLFEVFFLLRIGVEGFKGSFIEPLIFGLTALCFSFWSILASFAYHRNPNDGGNDL